MSRARWLLALQDVVLASSTALRMFRQDPTHFAVQLTRRVAPKRLRATDPKGSSPSVWRALRWFLMDRPEQAADDLRTIGIKGRLAAELASTLGVAEPAQLSGAPAARAWLARGELGRALECVPRKSNLAERIASERLVYSAGFELAEPRRSPRLSLSKPETPKPSRPRVLFILTNSLPYTQSGYTVRTHSILSELVRQGVEVLAVTRIGYPVTIGKLGNPESRLIDGVEYRRLPTWQLPVKLDDRLYAQAAAIRPIIDQFKPDVLHTTTDLTNATVTRALAQSFNLPWVYELRGQLELTWVAARPTSLQPIAEHSERVRLWRARDTELAHAAHRVVVLSDVQRDEMAARGVAAGKITILPNCVDDEVLQRRPISAADARERIGLPRDGYWVGSVTSVVDYEGLDVLVDAVALARSHGHDLRIAIVGDGIARPDLLAQVSRLGFDGSIAVLPGRVPRDESIAWYEALDVFAVPRRDTPVCRVVTPLKVLTAVALGRAVVLSDLPALRAVVSGRASRAHFVTSGDVSELAAAIVPRADGTRHHETEQQASVDLSWASTVSTLITTYEVLRKDG